MTCKTCTKCGESKSLDEFYAQPTGAGGRRAMCKSCCADEHREYQRRIKRETGAWPSDRKRHFARAKWAAIAAENAAP